jgi:hypothetical protein
MTTLKSKISHLLSKVEGKIISHITTCDQFSTTKYNYYTIKLDF